MNKRLILIFVIAFTILFAIDFAAAAPVTCLRTVDDYWCTEVSDVKYCDTDYGTVNNPAQCAPVCCVNVEGQCNSFLTKVECENFGGIALGVGACYNGKESKYNQCSIGDCNLAGDVRFGVSKSECDVLAAKNGMRLDEYSFSAETGNVRNQQTSSLSLITGSVIQEDLNENLQQLQDSQDSGNSNFDVDNAASQGNQNQAIGNANTLQGTSLGCCVVGDSCSVSNQGNCLIRKGQFNSGKICGEVSQCTSCQGSNVECSPDGSSIVTRNGCGEIINRNACAASTYCKINNEQAQCVSNDCSTGGKIVFPEINIGGGKTIPSKETISVDNKILGGKNKRLDGESWCMVFGQIKGDSDKKNEHDVYFLEKSAALKIFGGEIWKHSAGLTTYRFTCNNGIVSSSQCGGEFRDEICISSFETDLVRNDVVKNNELYCNIPSSNYAGKLNEYVQSSRNNYEQAICELNIADKIKDCRANYPKGSLFYESETSSPPVSSAIQQPQCSRCGDGFMNVCGEDECRRLDDCTAIAPGFGKVAGNCVKYALLAEAVWLTAGSITPIAVNPGWGGTVGSVKGPLEFIGSKTIRTVIAFGITDILAGDPAKIGEKLGLKEKPEYVGDGRIQK